LRQGKESEEEIEGIKMVCSLAENCDGSGRISKETAMADLCLAAELQGGGGALASVRRRGWPAGVRLIEDVLPAASGGSGWSSRRRTGQRRHSRGALGIVGARFRAAFIGARRRTRLPRMAAAARPAARSGPDGLCRAWPAGPARAQAGWVGPLARPNPVG
jgi:hypothetical protein